MLSRIKFEIEGLASEILDQLPQSVWTSKTTTFLDPAIGGGQFIREIERRLRAAGHSDLNICERVMGCESSRLNVNYALNKYKVVSRLMVCDFLTEDFGNMKFDVVIGNPPFQKSNNEAKRWTLWEQFVKKSFELGDFVAMITPQSITSPGPFNLIKDKATVINTNISNHFGVGSTFCYFIAPNKLNQGNAKLIAENSEFECKISEIPFLPFILNEKTIAQIAWLQSRKFRKWRRGELHTSKKDLFHKNGKHTVMHTNAQELKSNVNHENLSKIRVAVSLSGYPKFRVIHNAYLSQACVWTEFTNLKDAEAFAEECNGEFVQDILTSFKWSGWNSKEVIEHL